MISDDNHEIMSLIYSDSNLSKSDGKNIKNNEKNYLPETTNHDFNNIADDFFSLNNVGEEGIKSENIFDFEKDSNLKKGKPEFISSVKTEQDIKNIKNINNGIVISKDSIDETIEYVLNVLSSMTDTKSNCDIRHHQSLCTETFTKSSKNKNITGSKHGGGADNTTDMISDFFKFFENIILSTNINNNNNNNNNKDKMDDETTTTTTATTTTTTNNTTNTNEIFNNQSVLGKKRKQDQQTHSNKKQKSKNEILNKECTTTTATSD